MSIPAPRGPETCVWSVTATPPGAGCVRDVEMTLRPYDTVGHAVAMQAMWDKLPAKHGTR